MVARVVKVHTSLQGAELLLGGERKWVLVSGMLSAILIFSISTVLSTILGIISWLVFLAGLRRMARYDPQLSSVFFRMTKYQRFYPARAHPSAPYGKFSG